MLEMLVGMEILDPERYRAYRKAMLPLLEQIGGSFRYDFTVGETLKSASDHVMTRVFTIAFPDADTRDRFFSDPAYLEIKRQHFEGAVGGTTIIAEYEL